MRAVLDVTWRCQTVIDLGRGHTETHQARGNGLGYGTFAQVEFEPGVGS